MFEKSKTKSKGKIIDYSKAYIYKLVINLNKAIGLNFNTKSTQLNRI
jgi:hypothetical protein